MAITLVIGKPGSGKSYFAVSKIAEKVLDWARYEKNENENFDRELYTNLHLNLENFQDYVDARVGGNYEVEKKFHFLEDDFFYIKEGNRRNPCKWWDNIPNGALIVIDEVHQYMPTSGTGSKEYMQEFVEYCATHRHRSQDLILITQHPDNINRSILNMAGDVYHILNAKSRVLKWVNIPLADIDVIKEAWGFSQQIANVVYGNYVGRSLRVQNTVTIILQPEIFALYQSHIHAKEGGGIDRPGLKLGRFGSIVWFVRKHFWHLSIKAGIVYFLLWGTRWALTDMPRVFQEGMMNAMEKKNLEKNANPENSPSSVVPPAPTSFRASSGSSSGVAPLVSRSIKDQKEDTELDFFNRSGIYVYGTDFIITKYEGRVVVGDEFLYLGRRVVLDSVDYKNKRIKYHDCPLVFSSSDASDHTGGVSIGGTEASPEY